MLTNGFAWSRLYMATAELATTDGTLPDRVQAAYWHLAPLNCTNAAPATFARLKALRAEYARRTSECDEDDGTITLLPLTPAKAAEIAAEIISMFDEVAKEIGAEKIAEAIGEISEGPAFRDGALLN